MTRLRQRLLTVSAKLLTLAVDPEKATNSRGIFVLVTTLLVLITLFIFFSLIVTYDEYIGSSLTNEYYMSEDVMKVPAFLNMELKPENEGSAFNRVIASASSLFLNHQDELREVETVCMKDIFIERDLSGFPFWPQNSSYNFQTFCLPEVQGMLTWNSLPYMGR